MTKSIVLLSGGLDSTVNTALAALGGEVVVALTADYGQRAAGRELASARAVCRHYAIKHRALDLRWLGDIAGNPLTRADQPLPTPAHDGVQVSDAALWIPNRNGLLLNVGAAYAEALEADRVVAGFNAEEAVNFPDNGPDFLVALNRCFEFSTRAGIEAFSYTVDQDKAGVVALARRHDVPLELTWCCYDGGDTACWRCGSCVRFRDAVRAAGCEEWLISRGLAIPGA